MTTLKYFLKGLIISALSSILVLFTAFFILMKVSTPSDINFERYPLLWTIFLLPLLFSALYMRTTGTSENSSTNKLIYYIGAVIAIPISLYLIFIIGAGLSGF